jgi:DNA-directed RNA polymerase subunit RPC12/RpoP
MIAYECLACGTTFNEEDGEDKYGYLVCPSCGDNELREQEE